MHHIVHIPQYNTYITKVDFVHYEFTSDEVKLKLLNELSIKYSQNNVKTTDVPKLLTAP